MFIKKLAFITKNPQQARILGPRPNIGHNASTYLYVTKLIDR